MPSRLPRGCKVVRSVVPTPLSLLFSSKHVCRLAKQQSLTTLGHERETFYTGKGDKIYGAFGGGAPGRVAPQCGPTAAPDHRALPRAP
jgi:hypothetical protein